MREEKQLLQQQRCKCLDYKVITGTGVADDKTEKGDQMWQ